ncbi:precorrin-2 C20-methyltransferase / cobalt-factor II C20-methyltransferase [Calothrix parasitica NIES-267]|uniref:Precorrin-2 C20-methyltransferase / cobalt-factor II C20-methyltransferase n=1 Tax=Calothrix parasitica NIES-267 TaxID=1973488 RepID=A0A1Z4LMS9_9CYAN|nr:precorrin-2 C20-methyltransferase / cobalt-factor II C20-methyltransferase [Calothrix parasitica NIES-267]
MNCLYGLGVGTGNPELITLKALRILQSVSVIAYPASETGNSFARSIVAEFLQDNQIEIPIVLPFKLEKSAQPFYDKASEQLAEHLNSGRDVAVLCEGDPFFYGSFMYIYDRLSPKFDTEIIPGISSVMASAAMIGIPLTYRNDVFMVVSGILSEEVLKEKLKVADAAVIIKLGKNFNKVKQVLEELGLIERAKYIENATRENQKILSINEVEAETVPYFSLIVIPSQYDFRF